MLDLRVSLTLMVLLIIIDIHLIY